MNTSPTCLRQRCHSLSCLTVLLTLALFLGGARLNAQLVTLSATPSANSIRLGQPVTFTLNLTNFGATLFNVFVTNTPSQTVTFTSPTTTQGIFTNTATSGVFELGSLIGLARMTFTVTPTAGGSFTNFINVFDAGLGTNLFTTNVVVAVTLPQADLSVTLATASQNLLVNDQLNYNITVVNSSASPVANVQLTNSFPGARFLSSSPQSQSTVSPLLFNLGRLAAQSSTTVSVAIQPTNAGTLSLSAGVGAPNFSDANPSNNVATASITVSDFLVGTLTATNASSMVFNPQTGLMEQTVRLSNVGTNSVPAARVFVLGLTNVLRNAVGTNNANPFVLFGAPLDPGQSADLRLEYFIPTRLPINVPNSSYVARAVPAPNLSVSGSAATNAFSITRIVSLANGNLIEFQSTLGASYTILYSPVSDFSTNVLTAQPAITAPADRVQWIDDGPPKTVSVPTSGARFYRVRRN